MPDNPKVNKSLLKFFMESTAYGTPHGSEGWLFPFLRKLSKIPACDGRMIVDSKSNIYLIIGEKDNPKIAFACHLDTVHTYHLAVTRNYNEETGIVSCSKDDDCLGADDKAGMTILVHMIQAGIPGLYCFFVGEERGGVGSKHAASIYFKTHECTKDVKAVISFDRYGTTELITHQGGRKGCSDAFAEALCKELSLEVSDRGSFTDSKSFFDIVPECVNVAVGYDSQHTCRETQDMVYLSLLLERCLICKWEDLPIVRDPKTTEYQSYKYNKALWDDGDYNYHGGYNLKQNYNFKEYKKNGIETVTLEKVDQDKQMAIVQNSSDIDLLQMAVDGESIHDYLSEERWKKVITLMKADSRFVGWRSNNMERRRHGRAIRKHNVRSILHEKIKKLKS